MNTNRLSKIITASLNKQMTQEAYAAEIYLSYGAWAAHEGYGGIARFLFRHSQEERNHMMKILEYILRRGAEVQVTAISGPHENPKNLKECFENIFTHETDNTKSIYKIVKMSLEEEDWATWNFMQWFVKEQIEEEALALDMLDKLKVAGGDNLRHEDLYSLDRDMENAPDEIKLPQEVTAENP
ncbi:MAG: ferritin [Bacteroidetes bacterium]|nr:ferritin [Bacteroidota bacterium]